MSYRVIDNFLDDLDFKELQNHIIYSGEFAWYSREKVTVSDLASKEEQEWWESQNWNWYLTHMIYYHKPYSPLYDKLDTLFIKAFNRVGVDVKSWVRIKANFYPNTVEVKEHQPHSDADYSHQAALFSLNTCDGFTRMPDGTKVDSIENRIVIFDGGQIHNSSTTSNSKIRYNINFNFF